MKTKIIEVCDAVVYNVSCAENDYADIRCGGPVTLGYDFIMSPDENTEEIINHIKNVNYYNLLPHSVFLYTIFDGIFIP
jgi:hypothetical protein